MNTITKIFSALLVFATVMFTSCEISPDPGFDGAFSGVVMDTLNNPVYSDVTSNVLLINALGENDKTESAIRVKGDGTFANLKLYPKRYKIWVKGPVFIKDPADTISVDFTGGKSMVQNFTVVPFITTNITLMEQPIDSLVKISYEIKGNRGKVPNTRELYCSTAPFPTKNTGTAMTYKTVTVKISNNIGQATITGLSWGTKYFVRIGANTGTSNSDPMNYSNQIIVTTATK